MKLEQKIGELCDQLGIQPADLNLGIGIGNLSEPPDPSSQDK